MIDPIRHLRLALRALGRRPSFCAVVVLTLGLGIGASSAIFSVVNGVLLKPLPFRDPDRLAMIWSRWNNFDKTWISPAEYVDYRGQERLFAGVGAWAEAGEVAITDRDRPPESQASILITAGAFDVLGVSAASGRVFSAAEDVPNGPAVVMIGYELWQRRWGGDPGLVGGRVQIDGEAREVVGILPRGFRLPLEFRARETSQIFLPAAIDSAVQDRGNHGFYGVARLREGVTFPMAAAGIDTLTKEWNERRLYPAAMRFSAFAIPLADEISGPVRPALAILSAAVLLLLLLTYANVANLVLIRADSRSREVAVRSALGAGLSDLLRLALTESLLLGVSGGVVGLAFAWAGMRMVFASGAVMIPRAAEIGVDGRVVAFGGALAVVSGLVLGVLPMARAARLRVADALRDGRGQSDGPARRRARAALVVAEMAFAVMLLVGAGLTLRSFVNLTRIEPGFDASHLLTLRISLPASRYDTPERANALFEALGDRVRRQPGVEAAGFVRLLPLASEIGDSGLTLEGKPTPPGEPGRQADWQAASPGYFEAMKIRLVRGRFVSDADSLRGEPAILVSEALARDYFPGEDPIGRRMRVGAPDSPWLTVVGVVGDVMHNGLLAPPKRAYYVPQAQWSLSFGRPRRSMALAIRTAGAPDAMVGQVQRLMRELDAEIPLTRVAAMSQIVASATVEQRFTASLMAAFAMLALVLASIGIYGVISYSVSQRTLEIGIRMALGADLPSVRGLVLRQGMAPAIAGTLAGLVGAGLGARRLGSILYGVAPGDPLTFGAIPAVLLAVAFAAVMIPAVRASRVDPVEALRAE